MKFVILGTSGMLGTYVSSYLRKSYNPEQVKIVTPSRDQFDIAKQTMSENFADPLNLEVGDVVINCAGIINKEALLRESIIVNSIFPQLMSQYCKRRRITFIHISTDCVFDGIKGNYSYKDKHNASDIYGITKSCGEPDYKTCILIRTSIIGESKNGRSLVEWLRTQKGKTITGYENHKWNGVTCLTLAKCIIRILDSGCMSGLFILISPHHITKYELCKKISEAYGWNINIEKGIGEKDIDRTLVGNVICKQTIDEQIKDMVNYKF